MPAKPHKLYLNRHPNDATLLRLFVPYQEKSWITYIALVKGSFYDEKIKSWVIPNKNPMISDLQEYFGKKLIVNLSWKSEEQKKAVRLSGVKAKVTVRVIGACYARHITPEGFDNIKSPL